MMRARSTEIHHEVRFRLELMNYVPSDNGEREREREEMIKSDEESDTCLGLKTIIDRESRNKTNKRKLFISGWVRKPIYIIITHQSPDVTLLCNLIAFLFKPAIFVYSKEEESPYKL